MKSMSLIVHNEGIVREASRSRLDKGKEGTGWIPEDGTFLTREVQYLCEDCATYIDSQLYMMSAG
jgi:hypothetical protein